MKHISIILLLFLSGISSVQAQQRNPAASDTTTVRFIVKFTPTSAAVKSGSTTTFTLTGVVDDPISRVEQYNSTNVNVGNFFVDGLGNIFRISAISSRFPFTFDATVFSGTASSANLPPVGSSGVIYQPTPNLLLPQWVTSMSSTVQGALLSHMANMIDLKLSSVSSPIMSIKVGNYTLTNADDTILFDLTSTTAIATLPAASTVAGKTFKIGKVDESTNILTFSPAIRFSPTVNLTTLNYPRTFLVQSDGTNWWVVNQN